MPDAPTIPFTEEHRRVLRARRLTAALGTLAFGLVAGAAVAAGVVKWNDPAFLDRGQWVVWGLLALFWLWWLAPSIPRLWRVQRDLQAGLAESAVGELETAFKLGFGLVQTVKYTVTVGRQRFAVDAATYHRLKAGGRYTVTFAPLSQTLLDAKRWVGAPAPAAEAQASPAQAPSTLTPLERRLLGLIAEGRSNKEIAVALNLSVNTVKVYNSALFAKLGASRRTEAVARAREQHLL